MSGADVSQRRLRAQRISTTAFTRPSEVVGWLGAMQAQDYLGALWGVGLRLTSACEAEVERALAEGTIVRTWPLRGTLHFVAAADAAWMLDLLGSHVARRAAPRLRALELDDAVFTRARRVLGRRLRGGKRLTRPAVYDALERARISTRGQRGIHILWRLALERFLCFGPREKKQQTFVLFDEWLPNPPRLKPEEALAKLATRYFTGHGPATAADFAWWSGLSLSEARRAIRYAAGELVEESIDGRVHWSAPSVDSLPAPVSRAYLLPAFDEFLVGYADRSASLDVASTREVNNGGGILKPTMVAGGRVVGTWMRRFARRQVVFEPSPFASLGKAKARAIGLAFRRYAEFVGYSADRAPRAP